MTKACDRSNSIVFRSLIFNERNILLNRSVCLLVSQKNYQVALMLSAENMKLKARKVWQILAKVSVGWDHADIQDGGLETSYCVFFCLHDKLGQNREVFVVIRMNLCDVVRKHSPAVFKQNSRWRSRRTTRTSDLSSEFVQISAIS